MTALMALAALAASLTVHAVLGRWIPAAQSYVDPLVWPVAWYAVARSQRSAMLMGCAAGLLQDAWFQAGVFGVHGFSRTLSGWALGGLGARFDLNHFWGQILGGGVLFLADRLIEAGLLLLLDLSLAPLDPVNLLVGAGTNGLLVAAVSAIVSSVRGGEARRGAARRRG